MGELQSQLPAMTADEKLDFLCSKMEEIAETLDRYRPLLERYERAAKANSVFGARRELRKGAANA